MTTTQVAYWSLQEEKRKNRAQEAELNRSNLEREKENFRSNSTREKETERANRERERENYRSNRARESETARSNVANEDLKRVAQREIERSNIEREAIDRTQASNQLQNYIWQSRDRVSDLTEKKRHNMTEENRQYYLGTLAADTAEKTGKSQRFANYTKGASDIWKTVKDAVTTVWNLGKRNDIKEVK